MSVLRGLVVGVTALGVMGTASSVMAQGQGDPKAGEALYKANKCATCHGDTGAGDGAMGQKLKDKPTNWQAGGGGLKGLNDQQVFDSIAKGGPAIGRSRAMPASPKLSEAEVWHLVRYVQTLAK